MFRVNKKTGAVTHLFLFATFMLVGFISGYLFFSNQRKLVIPQGDPLQPVSTSPAAEPIISPDAGSTGRIINVSERKISSNTTYPYLFYEGNFEIGKKVNYEIEKLASKIMFDPESDTIDVIYTMVRLDPKITSIKFEATTYGFGAAHPNHNTYTLNFSTNLRKTLNISDVFKPDSDFLKKLSELSSASIISKLKKNLPSVDYIPPMVSMVNEGTKPILDNFKNFNIDNSNLILIFDPYQTAPYSSGTQVVKIPFKDLGDILNLDLGL